MKWFALLLGFTLPCVAATLSGIIKNENNRPISGARIVVIHDLSPILVQRTVSDRNGTYSLSLETGPYRVFVLKKGYDIDFRMVMVAHPRERNIHRHELSSGDQVASNDQNRNLKIVLRRSNREPYKTLITPQVPGLFSPPKADESLLASVSTEARHLADGQVDQVSTVAVQTQLPNRIALSSHFRQQRRTEQSLTSQQISADFSVTLGQYGSLGLAAESIANSRSHDHGQSKKFGIKGAYGQGVKAATEVSLTESREHRSEETTHQNVAVHQALSYSVADHKLEHQLSFADWQYDHTHVARQTALATQWYSDKEQRWGAGNELSRLNLPNRDLQSTRAWLSFSRRFYGITSKHSIGIYHESDQQRITQSHHLVRENGPFSAALNYDDQTRTLAFNASEVFGAHMDSPVIPYRHEGFFRVQERKASLNLAYDRHLWQTNLSINHRQSDNDQLFTSRAGIYKDHAQHRLSKLSLGFDSQRYRSRVEIHHGRHDSGLANFIKNELTYAQTLAPFRDKNLGLLFQFQIANHPDFPTWWLLQETPWDPSSSDTWYEGQVRFTF